MTSRSRQSFVLAAVALDLMGFGMVFPDIQTRAERFLRGTASPGVWIGVLLALSFVVQLFVAPRWGRLSDRVGRAPIFVVCQLLSAAALAVYGGAATYAGLALSRVLSGLGSANVAVAQAFVSDTTEGEERGGGLGRVAAAISAGLVLGPAAGGFLAEAGGNRLIGIVGGSLSLVGAGLGWIGMRGLPLPPHDPEVRKPRAVDLSLLGRLPAIRPLFLVATVASFALATLEGTFGRLIARTLGYGEREFGIVFSYESVLSVGMQAFALAWIARRIAEGPLLRGAFFVQALGLALFPFAGALSPAVPGMVTLLAASTLYALASGAINPTIATATSRLTPEGSQGELFSLLQIARNFGFVVGPILGGRMFDLAPAAPYLFAGAVSLTAMLFVPRLDAREIPAEVSR